MATIEEVIACFNSEPDTFETNAGVINEAFHKIRTGHAIRKAARSQNKAAKAAARYTAHAAKKLNAEDFHHFNNGNTHLISKKGQSQLAKKDHLRQAFQHHNEQAKQHFDHASDLHSLKMGHGVKQARAHREAQRQIHTANVSKKMANHLTRRIPQGAHETAKNNFRSAAHHLNQSAAHERKSAQEKMQKHGLTPQDLRMNHIAENTSHNNKQTAYEPHPEDHDVETQHHIEHEHHDSDED